MSHFQSESWYITCRSPADSHDCGSRSLSLFINTFFFAMDVKICLCFVFISICCSWFLFSCVYFPVLLVSRFLNTFSFVTDSYRFCSPVSHVVSYFGTDVIIAFSFSCSLSIFSSFSPKRISHSGTISVRHFLMFH